MDQTSTSRRSESKQRTIQKDISRVMDEVGQNRLCHHSDAYLRIRVLHGIVVYDNLPTMENVVRHLREGGRNKDIFDPTCL